MRDAALLQAPVEKIEGHGRRFEPDDRAGAIVVGLSVLKFDDADSFKHCADELEHGAC